ncbi:MAG: flagellar hook-associated protein FlgL [Planctomycetota bacterium]
MSLRVSTHSTFARVLLSIQRSQSSLIRAQEQVASGRRLLRLSDDSPGAARALSLTRQIADVGRHGAAIAAGLTVADTAAAGLQDAGNLLSEARALLVQGMTGTLTMEDRESLAGEFDLLRDQLLEIGNLRSGDRYLFGGTSTGESPWVEIDGGGRPRIVYRGNEESQLVRIGEGVDVSINLPGTEVFGRLEYSGTSFAGLTGVASGLTADEGTGYEYLRLRHEGTVESGLAGVGIALVDGGAEDTLLGDNALVIDAVAGTIQLGAGPAVQLPDPSDPDAARFVVENERGGKLYLDLSGFTGADYAGTVRGEGSISLDGSTFVPLTFTETDLELTNPATGSVLHVDASAVKRAGDELVTFGGTVNLFDLLQGIGDDLRNADGLEADELVARLEERMRELDRGQENLLVGLGVLGAKSQRLNSAAERSQGVQLQLEILLSNITDADYAEVALDLARSDLSLQVAQASGARLIQTSLLNFLG